MPLPAIPNALDALKTVAQKPAMSLPPSVQKPLTEEQLSNFYLNPQLDAVDDFVDGFVKVRCCS
jgi:hypothetical protein